VETLQLLRITGFQGFSRVSLSTSTEDGNRPSFRNIVSLVFGIPDDGQSPEAQRMPEELQLCEWEGLLSLETASLFGNNVWITGCT
jgi:hypothetical protein